MRILIIIFIFGCAGCVSNGFLMARPEVLLYGTTFPAKSIDAELDVFETNSPKQDYIEIAKITCGDTDDSWNLKQILIKAKEIGADAIIITGNAGSHGAGVPIGNVSYVATQNYGMSAVAIKYE